MRYFIDKRQDGLFNLTVVLFDGTRDKLYALNLEQLEAALQQITMGEIPTPEFV